MRRMRAAVFEPGAKERARLVEGATQAGLTVTAATAPTALGTERLVLLGPGVKRPGQVARSARAGREGVVVLAASRTLRPVRGVDGLYPLPLSPKDLQARLPELLRPGARTQKPKARRAEPGIDPETGFFSFPVFKELVRIELKRARRYGYQVAICLVALDPLGVDLEPKLRLQLEEALTLAARRALRDTDFPVQYRGGRVLLLMPHTDLPGSLTVGWRICKRISALVLTQDGLALRPTVSVGVAASVPGRAPSLATLIRAARENLDAARRAGGNRVEFSPEDPVLEEQAR